MRAFIAVVSLILILLITYISLPTLAWGFYGWMVSLFFILLWGSIFLFFNGYEFDPRALSVTISIGVVMLILVPLVSTWAFFGNNDDEYRAMLGPVEEKEVNSFMEPINADQVAIIDDSTARMLADKILGTSDKMLGSQAIIGPLELQKVKDGLFYVAPLLHSGFFKYWDNSDAGTNGYVMVSATNEKDVRLVQNVGGKPVSIVYQPRSFFGKNLERHVYMNGYASVGTTNYSFEIDDEGNPFYVISLFKNTVGFAGSEVYGVCVVNVQDGTMKEYSKEDAPEWIDRIEPHEFVETQVDDWGDFVNGWYNPSNKDRVTSTDGMSLVYGDDDRCSYYVGITSVGNDESSIGFMMIDSRTKKVTYYKQAGATEHAAMISAQGKVADKRYRSSFPRPYNIDGKWTYVMSLKDNGSMIKGVAMVSVSNHSIVGVGDDVRMAMRDYKSAWNSKGNAVSFTTQGASNRINGTVDRCGIDVRAGNTYYYFTMAERPDKAFVLTSSVSEESVLMRVGDKVDVAFDDGGAAYIDVQFFDILSFSPSKTDEQIKREAQEQEVTDQLDSIQSAVDTRASKRNEGERMKILN